MMMLNLLDYVHVTMALSVTAWAAAAATTSCQIDCLLAVLFEREFQGDDTEHSRST